MKAILTLLVVLVVGLVACTPTQDAADDGPDTDAVATPTATVDISMGKKFGAVTPPAPAPDAVKLGCGTVFIGG